jgi:UDP-N-acetyl-D-galactosamine dehydrogenase
MGFTFKENCPDIRNTRVIDLVCELQAFDTQVDIYDPQADGAAALHEYGVNLMPAMPETGEYDALVVAVSHDEFKEMGIAGMRGLTGTNGVVYDIKGIFGKNEVDGRL